MNTAGSLKNFFRTNARFNTWGSQRVSKIGLDIASSLIEELKSQRMIALAEDSKLLVDISELNPYTVFEKSLQVIHRIC